MKRLVLHATDMDVPKNLLLITVVTPPQHGSIVTHKGGTITKRHENNPSPVVDFTMEDLHRGTLSSRAFHLFLRAIMHLNLLINYGKW